MTEPIDAFGDSPLGEMWRWLVGGLPIELQIKMRPDDMEQTLRSLLWATQAGGHPEDYMQVREDLRGRLTQRMIGRPSSR